ncbi:uncharacterized protein [Dendropsophus ebraccatus]|uniref:uncharacterized protein n=1 Tax=Dendropsophus ebraccatus TaxID=150705 RepID=UPI0038321C5F
MRKFQDSEDEDFFSVPKLTGGDMYHVFISFSSADATWVEQLIRKLEAVFSGIKICVHNRDFTAGKTIIENMTECIQKSQKIVMVLSPDFVHSRWCLFEANLSMFQDCGSHKAIVPVMLRPCPMPLYLSHLTYLEAKDREFFKKLCERLLRSNARGSEAHLVHYQSPIKYSGTHLLSLSSLNRNDEEDVSGAFPETCVPDALKAVVKDPEIYTKAIRRINNTPPYTDIFKSNWIVVFLAFYLLSLVIFSILTLTFSCISPYWPYYLYLISIVFLIFMAVPHKKSWEKKRTEKIVQNMSRRAGEANLLLAETSVLAGCASKSSLVFVFVSLRECEDMFHMASGSDTKLAQCMWEKAIIKYSSDYATCITNKHFPGGDPPPPGHLVRGVCFCQYVAMQIEQGNWP